MADKEKKVDEAEELQADQAEPKADQVERVGEAEKAEAEAIEALPKVEEAAVPKAAKTDAKPSKLPKGYKPRLKADYEDRIVKAITGQRPVITKAKKSIAQFKLREGMPIGCKVTLRRERMYEFLDRLVTIALPRVRDFRGLNPRSFDGRGNYAMGLKEQIVFPEINYDRIDKVRGMDIIVTTTAKTDEEARELLRLFNFPFPAEQDQEAA